MTRFESLLLERMTVRRWLVSSVILTVAFAGVGWFIGYRNGQSAARANMIGVATRAVDELRSSNPLAAMVLQAAANRASDQTVIEHPDLDAKKAEEERQEKKSFALISLDSLMPGKDELRTEMNYRLTNKSGQPIDAVFGAIHIYDQFGEDIDSLGLNLDSSLAVNQSIAGQGSWRVSPRGVQLLLATPQKGNFKFKVHKIIYSNGSREDY